MQMDKWINIYLFIFVFLKQSNRIGACRAPLVCNANLNRLAEKENINATIYIVHTYSWRPHQPIHGDFVLVLARLLKSKNFIKIPSWPISHKRLEPKTFFVSVKKKRQNIAKTLSKPLNLPEMFSLYLLSLKIFFGSILSCETMQLALFTPCAHISMMHLTLSPLLSRFYWCLITSCF